ncbi:MULTISPECIES: TfoX/Sxy family protein [unclassified Methylocystis]|nr:MULTISPECIES: TfoX/Sxy family protein [unclassified Methylocystis]
MFGGHGVYADGLFFAIEADGEIYLKADRQSAVRFQEAGSRPFVYQARTDQSRSPIGAFLTRRSKTPTNWFDGRSLRLKPRFGQARNGGFRPRGGARRQIPLRKTANEPISV